MKGSFHSGDQSKYRSQRLKGLKKSYKESVTYLYDTGAPSEANLKATRKLEAEKEQYKEADPAPAKGTSQKLWDELTSIKAMVNKTRNFQQKSQQKSGTQGSTKNCGDGKYSKQQKKGPGDPCFGYE